jgi:hypothetical protein
MHASGIHTILLVASLVALQRAVYCTPFLIPKSVAYTFGLSGTLVSVLYTFASAPGRRPFFSILLFERLDVCI